MLKFLRRGKSSKTDDSDSQNPEENASETSVEETNATPEVVDNIHAETQSQAKNPGFIKKLAGKISRTSASFGDGLGRILLGKKEIDEELLEEIETQLLMADVGMATTMKIMDQLAASIERDALTDSDALYQQLKQALRETLQHSDEPFIVDCNHSPFVILVVGVNGAGKTTTIGKLAKRFQNEGLDVMLAAGDTLRAERPQKTMLPALS